MIDPKTNPEAKPLALLVDPERIPEILKQGRFHVVWRWEWVAARGRWDKPPRQPNGKLASVDDPETWVSFEEALAAHQSGGFDGIGVVLTSERDLVGIDYDGVVGLEARTLAPEAAEAVAALGSYAEVSPSGTGLRVIAKGKLPPGGRRKGKLEMYDSGRYLTLTGHRLGSARRGSAQVEDRLAEIIQLHERVFGAAPAAVFAPTANPIPQNGGNGASGAGAGAGTLADSELLAKAKSWKNGGDFSLLYDHGDWGRYHSQSEADQALANYLAFATDRDGSRIDSLFRRSALMRPKWDLPHYSDGRTYGQGTIEKALAAVREGWKPGGRLERSTATGPVLEAPAHIGQQIGTVANLIDIMPTTWLWKYHLPIGMLGILDGDPGDGKSTMVADLAAHITTGAPWHDGSPCPKRAVIVVGAEDSLSQTVAPRLRAAQADLAEVLLVGLIEDGKGGRRMPSLPADIPLFEYTINKLGAGLIVFDPIMPYLAQELSANSDKDVRRALTPLAEMLDRTQCTGLMLRHYAKSDKVASAIYRGLGSIGFIGVSRFGMAVKREKEDENEFVLMISKANIMGKHKARCYSIEPVELDSPHGPVETSRIVWGEESDLRAGEMLTAFGQERMKKDVGKEVMLELLADGPVDAERVVAEMAIRGISKATAWRAKDALGIRSRKRGFSGWEWFLPETLTGATHSQGSLRDIFEEAGEGQKGRFPEDS